jgi:succinate dehydrogenase hydrophobic anchor subunit
MPRSQMIAELPGVEIGRESTRRHMALGSLVAYLLMLAAIVIGGWLGLKLPLDDVLKALSATAAVLSGVVGAVIGFYFRGQEPGE